ncbi:hypothetical protein BABINDRAFT_162632 [Babjeviella inositovora NRRL Y-12698]|uniref:RRM domain-containing protein n=1 Tax=Babjeviella inositovora NRRL Y-12698 TaxID=984486 RepID=A0A1E3QL24_9ASCO|nr:uncharacterized protein BABINDRAFT_162632 [Babjeviella inositovora NRRL Y-12698]ODQ78396.1 hypothetical protein BABINDRAFT_162632 [Babjeviella inositovora NRRL Y-12698]
MYRTNVLIPNRTVRGFRSVQQRPLGIAYIVFENAEEAEKAAASLNGTALNNRKLLIKAHVPYSPVYKASLKKTRSYFRKKKCEPVCAAVPEVESSETGCKDGSCEEVKLNTSESEENSIQGSQADAPEYVEVASKSEREVSEDTIFVGKISSKTTDTDLRSFFADFNPSEIYIFKGRATGKRRDSLKLGYHSQVSALVRISIDNGQALAIDQLSKQKLNGKSVTLRPAFISKIEEVKKAVAAREAYLKKEALEKEEPEKESHVVPSAESSQVDGINHDNEGS